jgi:hypothetical protein
MLWTGFVWLRIGTLGKLGNEPLGCIKCWELLNGCTTCGLSSSTQLHIVSKLVSYVINSQFHSISDRLFHIHYT